MKLNLHASSPKGLVLEWNESLPVFLSIPLNSVLRTFLSFEVLNIRQTLPALLLPFRRHRRCRPFFAHNFRTMSAVHKMPLVSGRHPHWRPQTTRQPPQGHFWRFFEREKAQGKENELRRSFAHRVAEKLNAEKKGPFRICLLSLIESVQWILTKDVDKDMRGRRVHEGEESSGKAETGWLRISVRVSGVEEVWKQVNLVWT